MGDGCDPACHVQPCTQERAGSTDARTDGRTLWVDAAGVEDLVHADLQELSPSVVVVFVFVSG